MRFKAIVVKGRNVVRITKKESRRTVGKKHHRPHAIAMETPLQTGAVFSGSSGRGASSGRAGTDFTTSSNWERLTTPPHTPPILVKLGVGARCSGVFGGFRYSEVPLFEDFGDSGRVFWRVKSVPGWLWDDAVRGSKRGIVVS